MTNLNYTKKLLRTRPKNSLEKTLIKTLLNESECDSEKLEFLINEIFDYGVFSGAIPGLNTFNECALFYKKHKREINYYIETSNKITNKVLKMVIEEVLKDICDNVLNLELDPHSNELNQLKGGHNDYSC